MSAINPTSGSVLASQISLAVTDKAQDVVKAQGEAAVSMLEAAAQLQQKINSPPDAHRGGRLDVVA